jgi:hypothetical protein
MALIYAFKKPNGVWIVDSHNRVAREHQTETTLALTGANSPDMAGVRSSYHGKTLSVLYAAVGEKAGPQEFALGDDTKHAATTAIHHELFPVDED